MFSKLPWSSGKDPQQQESGQGDDKGESLTTILNTPERRSSYLLLVADCTDRMRQNAIDTFEPDKTGKKEKLDPEASAPTPHSESEASTEAENKEKEDSRTREQIEKEEKEKEQKAYEQRVKETSDAKVIELKQARLDYFDEWRDRILERVGEAVNQHTEEEEKHAQSKLQSSEKSASKPTQHMRQSKRVNDALQDLYPPVQTSLADLDEGKRILLLHSTLLLVLSLERYPAESRTLLLMVTSSLRLPLEVLTEDETKVARGLLEAAKNMNAEEETKKAAEQNSLNRKWKVGLGAVAGAVVVGVTGGLAAPLLAAGIGTVMGGLGLGTTAAAAYLGALASSAPLVGALFGAYGGRMTGKIVDAYAKEVSDFAFVPVHKPSVIPLKEDANAHRRLRVGIAISGWLTQEDDVTKPWRVISGKDIEAFALRWELEALVNLGNSLSTYVRSAAWGFAKKEIISRTVFAALSAGLWPLFLVKAARVVDNPFSVARSRAEKAGLVLADALINKVQGERPVTLIGYSLGARVIYSCLSSLADRKAFGLVENAVLVGAPMPSDSLNWRRMRAVVSNRLVNVYSTNDYLLAFLYRTSSLQYGIAGLQAVDGVEGVENVDVSGIVDGHLKYRFLTGAILKKLGMEDIDASEVEKEEKALRHEEQKEQEERQRKEVEAKEKRAQGAGDADEATEMEQEVEKKNQSMVGWMSDKMSSMKIGLSGGKTSPSPEGRRRSRDEQHLKESRMERMTQKP